MKKSLALLLSLVMIFSMSVTAFASESNPVSTTVITDPDEIAAAAAELGLTEDPNEIVEIIIKDVPCAVEDTSNLPAPAADFLNPEEFVFEITLHNPSKKGNLIRSSDYSYPGGTMTVSESLQITYSTEIGLDAEVVSSKIGFTVEVNTTVSDTQNIIVPREGQTRTCNAYVKLDYYEFNIIGDDVWFDDNLGTGVVSRPVGVIFVVTT